MLATLNFPAPHPGAALLPRAVRVRSADDLRRALRAARQGPLALDASGLDRVLRLDAERARLEVQAAAPWAALAPFVRVPFLPGTIGEAVSANAAGPDGMPVSTHVAAITLATPDGELRRASRGAQPELFRLALGGHGVFGVLYSVTLRVDSLQSAAARPRDSAALQVPGDTGSRTSPEIHVFVPPEGIENYLAAARDVANEHRVALDRVEARPLRAESETFLRWATRDWAGVSLRLRSRPTLCASVHLGQVRRALLEAAVARGGSFPIAGRPEASREQLDACYPALRAFLAEKRRYDPEERLQNGWYRRVTGLLRRESCESRWSVSG